MGSLPVFLTGKYRIVSIFQHIKTHYSLNVSLFVGCTLEAKHLWDKPNKTQIIILVPEFTICSASVHLFAVRGVYQIAVVGYYYLGTLEQSVKTRNPDSRFKICRPKENP